MGMNVEPKGHVDINEMLGVAGAGTAKGADQVMYLTPEALLTYVETQLKSLDGDIRKRLDGQRDVIARKKLLGDIEAALARGPEAKSEIDAAVSRALAELPENDPLRKTLESMTDVPASGAGKQAAPADPEAVEQALQAMEQAKKMAVLGEAAAKTIGMKSEQYAPKYTEQQCKSWDTKIKNELADLNAAAEINMIEVQSLMSQRATAVQLGTGMMQKIDQLLETIAKNIG